MSIFGIWAPNQGDEGKKKSSLPASPSPSKALPFGGKPPPQHLLPGPVAPPKKGLLANFSIFAPKALPQEEAAQAEAKRSEKPKSMIDALVPESSRGGMYEAAPEVFRRGAPDPESRPERAPMSRQVYGWELPTPEEFARKLPSMFNLDLVWNDARSQRMLPWFRDAARYASRSGEPAVLPLVPVGPVDDFDVLGYFFGIPRHVMDSYLQGLSPTQEVSALNAFWNEILWPLFDMTTAAFELLKPEDLPGWFRLDIGAYDPGLIELQYLEADR